MHYINGYAHDSKRPRNPALAGPELQAVRARLVAQLRERSLDRSLAPSAPSAPVNPPCSTTQPELPFVPPLDPPAPTKKRRSRVRGQHVRDLMWVTGRSYAYCQQLMQIVESGDPWIISRHLRGHVSVNRAASLL
jgi:hypothetical protein